jgi:lipoate-protein ligase A
VFHDLGNLNFTFIQKGSTESLIDFRKYTLPILEVLRQLGIDARFEGRNDLTIDGRKFSGNAEHIWKDKVLHHGTLLFSAHMTNLAEALNVDPSKFRDKAVKSVRSRVTNISEHLSEPMEVMQFAQRIQGYIAQKYPEAGLTELTSEDEGRIDELVRTKYNTWEWNFGYSPNYNFRKIVRTEKGGTLEFDLDVQSGLIRHIRIFGDYFSKFDTEDIEQALAGTLHDQTSIRKALEPFNIGDYFSNLTIDDLLEGMF